MEQTAANEETLEVECPTRQLVAFEHNYYHAAAVTFLSIDLLSHKCQ